MLPTDIEKLISRLPESAAPFLSFKAHSVKSLRKVFLDDSLSDQLLVIGSDGAGNPICIKARDDTKVILLEHENRFEPKHMNNGIDELIKFIAIYSQHVEKIQAAINADAWLDGAYDISYVHELEKRMRQTSESALIENSFWYEALRDERANLKQ